MKALLVPVLAFGFSASAFSFADSFSSDQILLESQHQITDGQLRKLEGAVRIETRNVIIRADKAVFNVKTRDVQPEGSVHITLKP